MIATTTTCNRFNFPKFLLVILFLGIVFAVGLNFTHAVNENHSNPTDAENARNCFKKNGSQIVLFEDGKITRYCYDPINKNVAVRVLKVINGKAEEITAYMKTTQLENGQIIYKVFSYEAFWRFVGSKINNRTTVTAINPDALKVLNTSGLYQIYELVMKKFNGNY